MRVERVEPTIVHGWFVNFGRAVFERVLAADLSTQLFDKGAPETFPLNPFFELADELVLHWLEQGSPQWIGDLKPLLWPALQHTLDVLRQTFGPNPRNWQWGRLHFVELRHPLVQFPGLGRAWKPIRFAAGGDGYTVNQSEVDFSFPPSPVGVIASGRLIMDVGRWDNSLAVIPGGQSGHPASAHYQDSLLDWRNGRFHPMLFSRERIEQAQESVAMLVPST
jgi:penicillin amidase